MGNDEPLDIDAVIIGWAYAHPNESAARDMDGLKSLALYCQGKGEVSVALIKSSWGRNNGYSRTIAGEYIAALVQCELVEIDAGRVYWTGD